MENKDKENIGKYKEDVFKNVTKRDYYKVKREISKKIRLTTRKIFEADVANVNKEKSVQEHWFKI